MMLIGAMGPKELRVRVGLISILHQQSHMSPAPNQCSEILCFE